MTPRASRWDDLPGVDHGRPTIGGTPGQPCRAAYIGAQSPYIVIDAMRPSRTSMMSQTSTSNDFRVTDDVAPKVSHTATVLPVSRIRSIRRQWSGSAANIAVSSSRLASSSRVEPTPYAGDDRAVIRLRPLGPAAYTR